MKTCTKCLTEKPLSAFLYRKQREMYYAHCRDCHAGMVACNYQEQREERDSSSLKWKKANPERAKEINRRSRVKNKHKYVLRERLHSYKKAARNRDIKWELTTEQFLGYVALACSYCGGTGFGVDRVDSSGIYEPSNCVPCCSMCNQMKLDYSLAEFFDKQFQIQARLFSRAIATADLNKEVTIR